MSEAEHKQNLTDADLPRSRFTWVVAGKPRILVCDEIKNARLVPYHFDDPLNPNWPVEATGPDGESA